jgi:dihydroneopterin aldolase
MNKLEFYGYHGLFPEEKKLGQRFEVDIELFLDLKPAGISDAMEDSVHYGEVFACVRHIVEGEPKNLIEAVAESIAQEVLETFSVRACRVRVTKPNPPVQGHYESVAAEIYRETEQ